MMKRVYFLISSILLVTVGCKVQKPNSKQFKVLSYNIWEGFQKDSSVKKAFIQWADTVKADVIALQEVNHFTNADIEKLGNDMGYPYAVLLKEKGYPTGLLSKYPISNIKRITDGMLHGYIYGKIKDCHFIVLHLNPFSFEKRNKEMAIVLKQVNSLPQDSKVLVMGDFNSLSPLDSVFYNSNQRKLKLLKDHEATRPHIKNVNNGFFDYSVMQSILSDGFIDTWKYFHPGIYEKSAPTLAIKTDPDNYVRIDYIMVSSSLKNEIKQAYIIKDQFTSKLSDHYPLVLIFKNNN